jgi:hypothetical protein
VSITRPFIALLLAAASLGPQTEAIQLRLDEANTRFTYEGDPIHPLAVRDLLSHLLDPAPGPVSVDLAGTRGRRGWSNRYFVEKISIEPDGTVRVSKVPGGWFAYRRLGAVRSGTHVVQTWDSGGGSGVFTNLVFLKFVLDVDFQGTTSEQFVARPMLLMRRVGEFGLGDRYGGTIVVREDTVEIAADDNNPLPGPHTAATVLRVP